jgi:regulation of enolase protein 1 (concanavalin A-like superfamily)
LNGDVGNPALSGSATYSGAFTIDGAGSGIEGGSDQFHFVYQQVSGDVDIIVRVLDLSQQHVWSKAGVMIRASLAANAAHGYALVSPARGVSFQRRPTGGGRSQLTAGDTTTAPVWLRAVRSGSTVTAFWSRDGAAWTMMGSDTIALGTAVYVGIAVTSNDTSARSTANVTEVQVSGASQAPPAQASTDIGSPAIAGSTAYSGGAYTIKAAGRDIWDTADQFRFVYQPLEGDGEIIARVRSLTNVDAWAKAGVMIRESLTAGSRHATAVISGGRGFAFRRRLETDDYSVHTSGGPGRPPGWLRVVRSGDLFTAYRSADGVTWTKIGSDTIAMGSTVYAGLAVTSHNEAALTTAVIDSVSITGSPATNQPPAVSLTAPANASTFTAPTVVSIDASASDPENRLLSVDFYVGSTLIARDASSPFSASWSPAVAGTYSLTAMAYDADGNRSASAPVSVTVQTATNRPPTVSLSTSGTSFTEPASITLAATASDPEGQLARVEFFNGSTRLATDTGAPYTFSWSSVPAGTYSLIAVAYDADESSASSAAVTVTVQSANKAPTVSLSTNGTSFTAPASITLTATASDPEGRLARVEFFSGSMRLAVDTSAPYSYIWSSVPSGTHGLTAVAYDADGGSASSVAVSVTVQPANQPPTVSLSTSGTSFTAPASITLTATASDPEGQLARVEFFNGSTLLATGTTAPYTYRWSSVAAGIYTLSAVAYDSVGASAPSAGVLVMVSPTTDPPRYVIFTASADHATNVTNYVFKVYVAGSDPATARPAATSDLGKPAPDSNNEIRVDLATFFTNLAPGDYVSIVTAVGPGGEASSASVTFSR